MGQNASRQRKQRRTQAIVRIEENVRPPTNVDYSRTIEKVMTWAADENNARHELPKWEAIHTQIRSPQFVLTSTTPTVLPMISEVGKNTFNTHPPTIGSPHWLTTALQEATTLGVTTPTVTTLATRTIPAACSTMPFAA